MLDNEVSAWRELVDRGNAAYADRRYAGSETSFLEALKLVEEAGGDNREDELRLATSLNNLASVYHTQGKYAMAEEMYERCLDLKLLLHGEDDVEVAINLHNLAVVNSAKRRYEKAEILYVRSLEIREKAVGADHPDLVQGLRNYALLLRKTKREEEAQALEARADRIGQATSSAVRR